jgi:hypothetical protein
LVMRVRDEDAPQVPDDGEFSTEFRDFIHTCLNKVTLRNST